MTSNAYPQTKLIGPKALVAILIYEFSFSELNKDLSGVLVRVVVLKVVPTAPQWALGTFRGRTRLHEW